MIENRKCSNNLTKADVRMLEASGIDYELAIAAGIERVDSLEGARRVGRESEGPTGKYSGLWIPYQAPFTKGVRGGRLRRDTPDIVYEKGNRKEKGKYLTAPGDRSMLYFGPGQGLEELSDTTLPVLIVEGEKKALATFRLGRYELQSGTRFLVAGIAGVWNWLGKTGKTTGPNGESLDEKGPIPDFDHIQWKSRTVHLCFDADWETNESVRYARKALTKELKRRGAKVSYFDVPPELGVKGIDDWIGQNGPDAVLAAFEAVSKEPASLPGNFRKEGDWLIYIDEDGSTIRICTFIEVLYRTSSSDSDGWGKLLRWHDPDGREHTWIMPSHMLASTDGTEIRRYLLDHGATIDPGKGPAKLLAEYLSSAGQDAARMHTSRRLGWNDAQSHYVLPDETIGNTKAKVIFQDNAGTDKEHPYRVSGTLDEWIENISKLCIGHSRLVFAVSAAFAGPLLRPLNSEAGGVNFVGPSGIGKTTALVAAVSVWGDGTSSWNATRCGIESAAERFNDSLMVLDELGEADARELAQTIYMLINGTGRVRMSSSIDMRRTLRWRVVVLSSGEISVADHAKTAGKQVKAGVDVRLLNVPANADAGYGVFDHANHELAPGDLAKLFKTNAKKYHGSAGRAFVRWLIDNREHATALAHDVRSRFIQSNLNHTHSGDVHRAADRFALFAAAGTLATIAGITGWPEDEAMIGASKCFTAWLDARGTVGSSDDDRALRQIRHFLEMHGNSRFELNLPLTDVHTIDRAGYREQEGSAFYVFPEVFKSELCDGFDPQHVAKLLKSLGHLETDGDSRLTKKPRLKVLSAAGSRFYVIKASIFDGNEVEPKEHAA